MIPAVVTWILARIAEDESLAMQIAEDHRWWESGGGVYCGKRSIFGRRLLSIDEDNDVSTIVAEQAARWSPERTLAECAAKRKMLDGIFAEAAEIDGEWGDGCSAERIREGKCSEPRVERHIVQWLSYLFEPLAVGRTDLPTLEVPG